MKIFYVKLLLILFVNVLQAQVIFEDFSDGDFLNNPTWNGNTSALTILGNNTLRSNGTAAGTYFLATSLPQTSIKGKEWKIQVKQNVASSSSNFSRIYLASDNSNLIASLTGYYLQLGETGSADVVELVKQTGNTKTTLMRGTNPIANAFNYDIKITNSYSGLWELSMKSVTSTNFSNTEATFLDNSNLMFSNFGIITTYTITNRLNFQFDNISLVELPNQLPPTISSTSIIGSNSLQIQFDKSLNESSITTPGNYLLNNNILPTQITITNQNILNLTFLGTTFLGINSLTINGIKDQNNNLINENTVINFNYFAPIQKYITKYKDLIINEIYADVSPVIGIPAVEYLEIYNNTNEIILMQNYLIKDGTTNRIINYPVSLAGNSFAIITNSSSSKNILESVFSGITIITLSGFGLTDGGESQKIINSDGIILDSVTFSLNWHNDSMKKNGGWSLELVSFTNTCAGNWLSSINPQGGTPGSQNSVFNLVNTGKNPSLKSFNITDNIIYLDFKENIKNYSSNAIVSSNNLTITSQNIENNFLTIEFSNSIDTGKVYTLNIKNIENCQGKILLDTTIQISILRKAKPKEVIISEIYADESPSNGLPEAEFIELFNTTDFVLDLSNFKLKDATTTSGGTIPNGTLIEPKSYLILTNTSKSGEYVAFGKSIGIPSFPSLNATGDEIILLNTIGGIIDKVIYSDSWYKNETKKSGGWSLERINIFSTCSGSNAWAASQNTNGGTPGMQNSLFTTTFIGIAPKIDNTLIIANNEINITFSEEIASYSNSKMITTNLLSITSNNLIDNKLNITFSAPLDSGIFYPIKIQNIKNCFQSTLVDTTIQISILRKAKPKEVIISEIYADESPSNGLPEAEFIELFNTTDFVLDLSNFKLKDATTTSGGTIPNGTLIEPKSYLILTNTSKSSEYAAFGKSIGIPSFPSLNATEDNIILLNAENLIIASVFYSETWYNDQIKQDGGFSLEKIDFSNPCETANNWSASTNIKGGTPGKQNSIQAYNPNLLPPQLVSCFAIDTNIVEITFDDILDSKSIQMDNFIFNNSLKLNTFISNLFTIKLQVTPAINPNIINNITIQGIKDCANNNVDIPQTASFIVPEKAHNKDIIINEILFNPFVGGADFVEIYNNSNKNINLKNFKIASISTDSKIENIKNITESNYVFSPKSYLVLTTDPLNICNNYPKSIKNNFLKLQAFPSLSDDKGNVVLLNSDSTLLDNFKYSDDYHYDLLEKDEGVSLERINFDIETNLPEYWHSAASTIGFATPGFRNSQASISAKMPSKLVEADPLVFSPDEDGYKDFTLLQCHLPENGFNISLHIFDYHGTKIKTLANNILASQFQFFKWDGLDDDGNKAKIGSYMVVLEGFNLTGQKIAYKTQVVVAGKF